MLVLTRKSDEQIVIGGDICIRVLKIKGSTVRLGIEAPPNVRVIRGELRLAPRPAAPQQTPCAASAGIALGALAGIR